jgi:receptor-type tyrosine-protein phosphatase Q
MERKYFLICFLGSVYNIIHPSGGCHTYSDNCYSYQEGNIRFSPQAHRTSTEGVVEMCNDQSGYGWEWGAISDSTTWTDNDARVVCREMGLFTSGARAMSFTSVNYGGCRYLYGPSYICTGNEQRLIDCLTVDSNYYFYYGIWSTNSIGVSCGIGVICTQGSVRLSGSSGQQGRVEICINNNWGTVCDSGWSSVDANIVCRQLGYSNADAVPRYNAYFGQGSGSILMSLVGCTGSESRLIDCSYSSSISGCSHYDDAGVQCQTRCTHGGSRVVGGSNSREGRVEVCLNGLWGTVCDDSWSKTDANVMCWQLGYSNADATVYTNAYFGQGIIPILMTTVSCSGTESRLVDCSYSSFTGGCYHYEDAGVRCQYRCTHGDVRIVDGSSSTEGRVEVCLSGAWGTVCDDYWTQEDANVVCRQLGFSNSDATYFYSAYFGQGIVPIKLDDVACTGSESQLISCSYDSNTGDCSHSEDAGVRCQTACTHGSVRLRGSSSSYQGRVEVCVSGVWGSVCHDSWGVADARVACRKVGYPLPNPTVYTNAAFGQASLPILLDDVQCSGTELTLTSCTYDSNTGDCSHSEDAGVKCQYVPSMISIGTALTTTIGYGAVNYYQYYFPTNGITITLNVGSGTIVCYASDRFQNPNEEQYDWKIVVSGYSDVFIDPDLLGRDPGTNIYIGLQGAGSSNTFTLDSTTGDTRAPLALSSDSGVSDSLGAGERTYYEFDFVANGVTLQLTVTSGTLICYASDLIQNPNEEHGYVWKVTISDYIDVFLDPDSLTRTAGSTLYVGLEGVDMSNDYTLNSTTGDRRVPESYEIDEEIKGSLGSNELNYFQLDFPSGGITFTLTVSTGYITCYASDTVQNPNGEQGYEWKVVTNSTVEVFLDPNSLDRDVGVYVYIGLEGGSSVNNFSLNSTSGDRRTPVEVATNTTSVGTVGEQERVYYQFDFPSNGVTITLNITTGYVICYASDRYRNPNEAQGYDWRIEVSGYADTFLDPALLSRSPGSTVYVAIEGSEASNQFTLGNTEGDRRVPKSPNTGEEQTGSVGQGERLFYRLVFPSSGLTIQLTALYGRVVCYASDRLTNPTATQGYDWRIETDAYVDTFIDPILLDRSLGPYIYIAIEGLQTTNNFSLNSTQGDRRVPFDTSIGSPVTFSLQHRELIYYRFSFPSSGLTLVLDIDYGSVICYASDFIQNPNSLHGYTASVEASYYNDSYIDPADFPGAVGGYLYIGIEGSSNTSNNTFDLNGTAGDYATKVPDPPDGVRSLSITATSVNIAWEAPVPTVATPISDIDHYELMVYESQFNLPTLYANTTGLSYLFTALEEYINYTCEIAAVNRVGQGQYSTAFIFLTRQAAPSSPPQSVSGAAVSSTLISLQWLPPVSININGVISKYVVEIEEVYTGQMYSLFTRNMHVNVGPLHPYYVYECSVAAHTISTGVFSSMINVTTQETVPTGTPLNLTDEEIGSRTVLLSWEPPEFELQNGRIRQYTIRVTHEKTGLQYSISTTTTQHLLLSLLPFHTYYFEVAAVTIGMGPFTQQLIVTLLEDAPDAAPESVSGYEINATSIFLGWEPPPNDTHNGIIRSYQINCTEVETGTVFNVSSLQTEVIITGLHPAYTYSCRVSAVTVDAGVFSGNVTIETEEAAPSGPPLLLESKSVLSRSVQLTWSPPIPEDRNGVITGYVVTVTNTETSETRELSTSYTSLTVSSLTPYFNYTFTVSAETAVGQGPATLELPIITAEDVPGEPQSPNTERISDSSTELRVSWEGPLEPNGVIISYKVYCHETNSTENVTTAVVAGTAREAIVEGLIPYTFYDCCVSANTSVGEGNSSLSARARTDESTPATSPRSVQMTQVHATNLTLSWSDPTTPHGIITGYSVRYNASDGNMTSFTTIVKSATLEDLNEYTVYKIEVSASTRVGFGPYARIHARTGQAKPHSAPTRIEIPSTSSRTATISWQPPIPDDRNGVITFYILIVHNLQFDREDITVNVSGSDLSYTVSGLEEYCRYDCQITAGTIIGSGPYSSRVQLLTAEDAPSAPPQNLMGSAQSDTIIDLTWTAPPAIDINGVIRYYSILVEESETGRSWSFTHVEPEISVGSLHPYYNYKCQVAAYTVGLGPYSNTSLVQANEAAPTAAPLGLRVVVVGSHSMVLAWEQPSLEHRNGRIRQYQIRLTEIETGDILQLVSTTAGVNISNLHPFYNYNCSVAAETIGLGPFSDNVPVQLDEYGPSDSPTDVTGQVIDSTSATLSWSPPPLATQNGVIRKYTIMAVEMDTGNEYTWESVLTTITIHSLHPFYTYQFTVAAFTIQQGPFSYIVTLQMDTDVPSAAPQNVTIRGIQSQSFIISWKPPPDEHQNGIITHYTITIVNLETGAVTTLNRTDTDSIISDLTPFTTYEVKVAAHTSAGRGPFSAVLTIQTQESAPNTPPLDFEASVVSSRSLYLSWSAPSVENRNGVIRAYHVNLSEVNTAQLLTFTTTNLYITIEGLHPSYTYGCRVSAFTIATGPFSNTSTLTLPEDVPSGYPQNLEVQPLNSHSVVVQWEPPFVSEQNGIITAYTIQWNLLTTEDQEQLTATGTNITVTDLIPHTTYAWTIAASTSVGMGPYSPASNVLMPEDAPTGPPRNLSGISTSSHSLYLTWLQPSLSLTNGVIRMYYITITNLQTGEMQQLTSQSEAVEVANLHPYYSYEASVAAYTVALGPFSTKITLQTLEDVPTGAPLSVTADVTSSRSISVEWGPPPAQEQNGQIIGYVIRIVPIIGGGGMDYETQEQSLLVEGLSPHTVYECLVAARTSVGTGPFSRIVTVQTQEEAPSGRPSNSTGISLNSTHILLSWDPPPLNQTHGEIEEYRITITEYETDSVAVYTSDTTELVVGPLHPYYIYNCSIQAVTVEAGPPIIIIVRTQESAPSASPTAFETLVIDATSIFLSWEPPPNENQNGIIRQYLIQLKTADYDNITIVTTETNVTVTNLHPYTLYECTVAAQTILLGVLSDVQLVTTHEAAPTATPQEFFVLIASPTVVQLEWRPPEEGETNGVIRAYIIRITELETGNTWQQRVEDDIDAIIEPLHPSYSYSLSVAAETVQLGLFTPPTTVEMPEDAPSSPPVSVLVSGVTTVGFTLSWSPPPEVDRNGIIRHFTVNLTEQNTGVQYTLTTTANTTDVNTLHPFYTYLCSVAAVTVSAGPYSAALSVTTLSTAPTGPPQNIFALEVDESSITLTWDPPPASEQNGVITYYSINMTTGEGDMLSFRTSSNEFTVSGLEPYKVYYFTLAAETESGQGPFSSSMPFRTGEAGPTASPDSMAIASIGATYAELIWNAPDISTHNGIIRFYIVSINEGETASNFTEISTGTRLLVTDLHPFYTYTATVAAVTTSPGPFSQHLSFMTLQTVPSGSPQEIEGSALSSSSLLLTWQPPPDEQLNGILTGYVVNMTEAETGNQYQILTDRDQYTLQDLHPFYRYTVIVAAVTVGPGPFSGIFPFQMPQAAPSAAPTSVRATVFNSSALSINWTPPPPDKQNGIITGYIIRLLEIITGDERLLQTGGPHTEIFITSLHPHYVYEFTVAAQTVGTGPLSPPNVIQMDEDVPSGAPISVMATPLSSTVIELMWQPPAPENRNGIIRQYSIHYYVSETRERALQQSNDNSTSVTLTDLHPYYTYSFRVAAVTFGEGPQSTEISSRTLESEPTGVPQSVEAVAVSSSSIRLTWSPPLTEEQNGVIRSYHINISSLEDGEIRSFETDGLTTIFILNSLHPFYQYSITIAAYTVGLGPLVTVERATHAEVPTGAPSNLVVVALNSSAVQVSWDPPPPHTQNGPIRGYLLMIAGANTDEEFEKRTDKDTNSVTVLNLHPFYGYTYTIAAIGIAVGPYSPSLTFKMPEAVCRAAVRNVSVAVESPTSVVVSWLPPDVHFWNGIITHYTVIYQLMRKRDVESSDEPLDTLTLTHPQPGVKLTNNRDPRVAAHSPLESESVVIGMLEEFYVYQFSVLLENAVGQSELSSLVTIEMPPAAPSGPPRSVAATALSSTSILITWDNPGDYDVNGVLTGFEILLIDSRNSVRNFTQPASTFSLHLESLNKYAEYTVKVSAWNTQGKGPASVPVSVRTLEDVPSAPVNATVELANPTAVVLKWGQPVSPNGKLLYYNIRYYGYKSPEVSL